MKKNIYFLLMVGSLLLFSCGKKTVIEGVVAGADSSKLVIENFNAGKPLQLKEIQLDKNGKFSFKVPALDTTEIYNLFLDSTQVIRLVVKPEESVTVTTSKKDFGKVYEVGGSEESKLLAQAENKLWQTRKELTRLRKEYAKVANEEDKIRLEKAYEECFAAHHDYLRHFVFDHSSSLVSYLALYQKIDAQSYVFGNLNDDKYVRLVAQKMQKEQPNSPYFALVMRELDKRRTQKQNARILEMVKQAENSYPNIELKDVADKEIALGSVKAKYVLLYFGVLNDAAKATLLPIYNKYHRRGLEIYFVDENSDKNIWEQAVKDLNAPWINVHDSKRLAASVYNVQQVPANYIIEVRGTIEGKDLFGAYLIEKLDKIL